MKNKRPLRAPAINDEMLRQAEELAGYGLRLDQIAAVLGFSERTLHNRKNENEALDAAIRRGKAKASAIVGKALFSRAKDGDVPAIRWWEMTRDGRSEKAATTLTHEMTLDAETDARLAKLLGSFIQEPEADGASEADA